MHTSIIFLNIKENAAFCHAAKCRQTPLLYSLSIVIVLFLSYFVNTNIILSAYIIISVFMLKSMRGEKMFKVKEKSDSSNKTVRLPNDLIERLEELAKDKNLSFSGIVIQCCEYALDNLEEDE